MKVETVYYIEDLNNDANLRRSEGGDGSLVVDIRVVHVAVYQIMQEHLVAEEKSVSHFVEINRAKGDDRKIRVVEIGKTYL